MRKYLLFTSKHLLGGNIPNHCYGTKVILKKLRYLKLE